MDFGAYPNLSFKLGDGRRLKVHTFVWQPSYQERIEVKTGHDVKKIKIERKMSIHENIFGHCSTHLVNCQYVDMYINHPPRLPNSVICILLSSEPINDVALYSELAVELYMDYVEGLSMETILERYLHDLDWENLALDVLDQAIDSNKDIQLDRSVHRTHQC